MILTPSRNEVTSVKEDYFRNQSHTDINNRPVENMLYQMYFEYEGTLHHEAIVANDHVDAIKLIETKYHSAAEVRLVFKGDIPHHLWMG